MRIEQLVERAGRLPVMLPVHARLVRMIQDADVTAHELGEAISHDPSLTAQVLRLVNSTVYGMPKRVGAVSEAVLLLGFDTIGREVLARSRASARGPAEKTGPLEFSAFWQHSVAVAAGARVLARRLDHEAVEAVFVAGLLHDIGRLLMAQYLPGELAGAIEQAWRFRRPLVEVERKAIGFTHCRLGAQVASRWDLPDLVVDAVEFHHDPDLTMRHVLEARIVQAADMLAKAMSLGYSGDDRAGPLPEDTCEALHLETDGLGPLMEAVLVEFNQVSAYVLEVLRDERQHYPENEVKRAAKTADTSNVR